MDDACDEDGLGAAPDPAGADRRRPARRAGPARRPDGAAPTAAGPLGDALHDLCAGSGPTGRPALLLRFVGQVREYLLALLWEAANREHRRVPQVRGVRADAPTHRRRPPQPHPDRPGQPAGRPAPARRADPALVALDLLAADLVCWCNDVFSYGKESRPTRTRTTWSAVIARETGGGRGGALRAAADRFNRALAAYLEAEAALLASGETSGAPGAAAAGATGSGPPTTGRWSPPGTPDPAVPARGTGRRNDHRG